MRLFWILPVLYAVLAVVFGIFLGGAGHGPGIAIAYYMSLPSAWIATMTEGNYAMYWTFGLGFVQWLVVGIAVDAYMRRQKAIKPK